MFHPSTLAGEGYTADEASHTVIGMDAADGFGMSLLGADLDGNGADELVIGASGYDSNVGRVYVVGF